MENKSLDSIDDGRLVVPYDKGRKTVTFYDIFFDINGDMIRYDDIAVIQAAAQNTSSMIYIYFSKSFTYNFDFTLYNGTKHSFRRSGYSGYGIGNYKRIKNEYETVSPPFYDIVFRKVCDRLIDRIENGATANICGLAITKDKITYEKRKETIVIDRNNFGRAVTNKAYMFNSAQIYLKDSKKPSFSCSLNEPNARLIVPVVNYFFEYNADKPAEEASDRPAVNPYAGPYANTELDQGVARETPLSE